MCKEEINQIGSSRLREKKRKVKRREKLSSLKEEEETNKISIRRLRQKKGNVKGRRGKGERKGKRRRGKSVRHQ